MIKYFTEKLDKRDKEFIDTVDLQKKEISDAFDYRLPMGLPPSDKLNRKVAIAQIRSWLVYIYREKCLWDYMGDLILALIKEELKKMGYLKKENHARSKNNS